MGWLPLSDWDLVLTDFVDILLEHFETKPEEEDF
jgi:hypothetical protein